MTTDVEKLRLMTIGKLCVASYPDADGDNISLATAIKILDKFIRDLKILGVILK